MKTRDLRELTRQELQQRHRELKEEMFNLRMQRSLKPLDNPVRLRQIRRDMAKVLTVLNEDARGSRTLASNEQKLK